MPNRKHPDFVYDFAAEHISWLRDQRTIGNKEADQKHAQTYTALHERVLEYLRDDPARDKLGMRKRYSVNGVSMSYRPDVFAQQVGSQGMKDVCISREHVSCVLTPSARAKVEAV